MKPELREKLIKAIDWEIGNCQESGIYPNICSIIGSEAGKRLVYDEVIRMVTEEGLRIDSSIAQLETTL